MAVMSSASKRWSVQVAQGTTVRLEVSGLTFSEILVEGHINID